MEGLDWQTFQIPFGVGMTQKVDARAVNPPELVVCKDAMFDEAGGLQTRYPFSLLTEDELADCRRSQEDGDELLVFTKDALLSWDSVNEAWVNKGTHLAVKIEEESRFVTTADQYDADRVELGGVVFYSWHESISGNSYGYFAASDAATGAVIVPPYQLAGFQRIRLTALETKVLLSFYDGITGIYCYALGPSDPAGPLAGSSTTVFTGGNAYFDVTKIPGADQAVYAIRRNPTTSYEVVTMTAGLTAARATKARDATGALAVSCPPTGTHVQVARANGASVLGDLVLLGDLSDVYVDQAIGNAGASASDHLAAAHRSATDGGEYRCYVYWRASSTDIETNWVDTGGNLGTEASFKTELNLASRAFDHDGRIYLWTAFLTASTSYANGAAGGRYSLQQTYFLFRDDGHLVAKAAAARAGDLSTAGFLPGVQSTGGTSYAWAGVYRRVIPIGGGSDRTSYDAGSPRDIRFTFDSDEARRCVRLGATLYLTGGEIRQYDGVRLTEVGFHVYPYVLSLVTPAAGNLADGVYAYKQLWRWDNARGETERSTSATVGTIEVASGPLYVKVDWRSLRTTHKDGIAVETWRTEVNPTRDAPFHLVTSKDPSITSNPNRFLENAPATYQGATLNDDLADASLADLELLANNVLEPLSPPPATIIAANADRLFLAGVAGEPNAIWYSKLRAEGEIASFHDALRVVLPASSGPITALAYLNETLVAFTGTSTYALPGDGYDNAGGGSNYGPARLISADCGAQSQEGVAIEPRGVVFSSRKGKYLLTRGWGVEYIGGAVSDYDDEPVLAVHVLEDDHQIRWLTTSRMLVLDYQAATQASPVGQWSEWTVSDGVHATLWRGVYTYLTNTGPKLERSDYVGVDYGLDVETAWIKMADLQGAGRVRRFLILGEYRGTSRLRLRIARDYDPAFFDDKRWPRADADDPDVLVSIGDPLQIKVGPSRQRCQAFKVRITAIDVDLTDPDNPAIVAPTTEALKLTGLGLEVGLKTGLHRRLSTGQRA